MKSLINDISGSRLVEGGFGIEKENIRVNLDGTLATSPHPRSLGHKLNHPYITTDFSESQVEMITPVQDNIPEAIGFIKTLHGIVDEAIGEKELLWPQSMPPILPVNENEIPIAKYGSEGKELEQYREYLSEVYGRRKQLVSGIHLNISFSEKMIRGLYDAQANGVEYKLFREGIYMKAAANFMKNQWFMIALLGASPVVHDSYYNYVCNCDHVDHCESSFYHGATSFRVGECGYRNADDFILDYSSLKNYQSSLTNLVDSERISDVKENYSSIRIKENPDTGEVSHLEIRSLDLNPLEEAGVSEFEFQLAHLILLYGLLEETTEFGKLEQKLAHQRQLFVANYGNIGSQIFPDLQSITLNIGDATKEFVEKMKKQLPTDLPSEYLETLHRAQELVANPDLRSSKQISNSIKNTTEYVDWHLEKARSYRAQNSGRSYTFHGKTDLELSTQLLMKEAIRRGIDISILDRHENFLSLTKGDKQEIIMQATKTSLDPYNSVLMMENKVVTKKILEKAGIQVPEGSEYFDSAVAQSDYDFWSNQAIVIKPKSTNFGLGITILKQNDSYEAYVRAVEIAFRHDDTILVEEFISGKEYRIFIIKDEVVGILHRVPANVTGDGKQNIGQLIALKNEDPLRGKGYKTPLEKIAAGEAEEIFLKSQGKSFDTIPAKGEVVYLRENSNISTGGDSIDFTDDVHPSYKKIAVEAAKAMNVNITGLDMMIDDLSQPATDDNYSIIEMNFNPAIHIHCHPFKGKNRKLDEKILDALELV